MNRPLEPCQWLSKDQEAAIEDVLQADSLVGLSSEEGKKLRLILFSILYAEFELMTGGKKRTQWVEGVITFLGLSRFFCETIGSWNFHTCHAPRFGYSKLAFARCLESFPLATYFVVAHIMEDIGLDKSPERILAEYNYNVCATSVAALQKGLNALLQLNLVEDGLVGPETRVAVLRNSHLFPAGFSLEPLNETSLLSALSHFEREHGITCSPFIPKRIVKKNWGYVFEKPLSFKRWRGLIERDIDVPKYVKNGTRMYALLSEEGSS